MTLQTDLTRRLDELEERLPSIPSKIVRLGRTTVHRVDHATRTVAERILGGAERTGNRAAQAARTTTGQARSGASRTATAAQRTAKESVGQARAQAAQTVSVAEHELATALDDATATIAPADLDGLTKAELYERAQELDIDGRSDMTKSELRAAIAERYVPA